MAFISITIAKPLAKRGGNFDRVTELTKKYPAIIWETAAGQCTTEQFNIIAESLRVANDDMLQPLSGKEEGLIRSPSFNKFFIEPEDRNVPFSNHWGSSNFLRIRFILISDVFRALPKFMKPKAQFPKRGSRIRYLCQPWRNSKCADNVGAKTYKNLMDIIDEGPSTVFCPLFFDQQSGKKGLEYIQDIAKRKTWRPQDLPQIRAREHAIIHEMYHVDAATGRADHSHITDVVDNIPGEDNKVAIYGASRSHNYAWRYVIERPRGAATVNPELIYNADNYAWVYTNLWFATTFNWQDVGSEPLNVVPDEDPVFEDVDFNAPPPDINTLTWPPNCYYTSDNHTIYNVHCVDMQGMTSDEWVAARNQPYNSTGGCELTSQCKMPAVPGLAIDPKCMCKCDGQITPLSDGKCEGFEGNLPVSDAPPNGAPPPR